jgi:hypothetical protein
VKRIKLGTSILSPCQIVARNLERVRRMRGWSQEQAAKELEPYLGYRLSRAAFSQAERSLHGGKIRRFDADEIVAFARAFEVAIPYFFGPPEPHFRGKSVAVNSKPGNPKARVTSPDLTRQEMLTLAQGRPDDSTTALITEVVGEKLHQALWGGFYQFLKEHPDELGRVVFGSGKLPAEFWAQIRTNLEADATAIAENRLAQESLERIRKSRLHRQPRASRKRTDAARQK